MRRQEMWTWALGGVSVAAIAVGLGLCASPGLALVEGPELAQVVGAGICDNPVYEYYKKCTETLNCTELNFQPWQECQTLPATCHRCSIENSAWTCINGTTSDWCLRGGTGAGGTPGCADCGRKLENANCTAMSVCGDGGTDMGQDCADAPQCIGP